MRLTRVLALSLIAVSAMTVSANADNIVTLYVNAFTESGNPLNAVLPGDTVIYQIAVEVLDDGTNEGLATMVYDVWSPEANAAGYFLTEMLPAETGYNEPAVGVVGGLKTILDYQYVDSSSSVFPGYNGGWGFDNSGLPTGGNATTEAGHIITAGSLAPLSWTADVSPLFPGNQNKARLGVGHGDYFFGDETLFWPA